MIAWWWVLVALAGMWVVLLPVAVWVGDLWDELFTAVLTVVAAPLIAVVWVLTRVDIGAVRITPRALARFAQARSADHRPAWAFYVRSRGIIVVRKWAMGDERGHVTVNHDGDYMNRHFEEK